MNNNQRVTEEISAKLPNLWVGYIIAALLLIGEIGVFIAVIRLFSFPPRTTPILAPIELAGWIYWFICVYQMHKVLAELTNSAYPITPVAAVGYHFIPLYNVYWIFKWPAEIAKFVNTHLGRKAAFTGTGVFFFLGPFLAIPVALTLILRRNLLGDYFLFPAWFLATTGAGGVELIVVFSICLYLSRRISQVIQKKRQNFPAASDRTN
jgi:hypothetical protein